MNDGKMNHLLPSFSGKKGEDISRFLTRYQAYCSVQGYNTNSKKLSLMNLLLKGSARDAWEEYQLQCAENVGDDGNPAPIDVTPVLMEAFLKDKYVKTKKQRSQALAKLFKYSMKNEESIEEFTTEFRRLLRLGELHQLEDVVTIAMLRSKLTETYVSRVAGIEFETLSAFVERLESIQDDLPVNKNVSGAGSKVKKRFDGKCHYCGLKGHKEAECRKKKSGKVPVKTEREGKTPLRTKSGKLVTCHICGQNHYKSDCPRVERALRMMTVSEQPGTPEKPEEEYLPRIGMTSGEEPKAYELQKVSLKVNEDMIVCHFDGGSERSFISRHCYSEVLSRKYPLHRAVRKERYIDHSIHESYCEYTHIVVAGVRIVVWVLEKSHEFDILLGEDFLDHKDAPSIDMLYRQGKKEVVVRSVQPLLIEELDESANDDAYETLTDAFMAEGRKDLMKRTLNTDLPESVKKAMQAILTEFSDVQAESINDLPGSKVVEVEAETTQPPRFKHYSNWMSPPMRRACDREDQKLFDAGIVETSNAEHHMGMISFPKPHAPHELRTVVNGKPLSSITRKKPLNQSLEKMWNLQQWMSESEHRYTAEEKVYLLRSVNIQTFVNRLRPLMNALEALGLSRHHLWIELDLKSGYFQLVIGEQWRDLFTYITPSGKLRRFCRLPQGWINSTAWFQEAMNIALKGLQNSKAYLDNIIIRCSSYATMVFELMMVLARLREHNLRIHPKKSSIGLREMTVLGRKLCQEGMRIAESTLTSVRNHPTPKTKRQVQRFLGKVVFVEQLIPGIGKLLAVMSDLTKKSVNFMWNQSAERAFHEIKRLVNEKALIAYPRYDLPFRLYVDASGKAGGGVLTQYYDGDDHIVRCAHKKFSPGFVARPTIHKEGYTLWKMVKIFRDIVGSNQLDVYTDHKPLVDIFHKGFSDDNLYLTRWIQDLRRWNISLSHLEGKKNTTADYISRVFLQSAEAVEVTEWDDLIKKGRERYDELRNSPPRKYRVLNDVLMRREGRVWKEVPRPEKWHEILVLFHATGHLATDKLIQAIRRVYFWPSLAEMASHLVDHCTVCQTHGHGNTGKGYVVPIMPSLNIIFNHSLFVDLVELPESREGFRFILTMICGSMKWAEAVPIGTKSAELVAAGIQLNWFLRYGAPRYLRSDRGGEFLGRVIQIVLRAWGVIHRTSSAYHPETQGRVERFNQSLKTLLRKLAHDHATDWHLYVQSAVAAYNFLPHQALGGVSPYEAVFMGVPRHPMTLRLFPESTEFHGVQLESTETLILDREITRRDLNSMLMVHQDRYQLTRASQISPFKVGDSVRRKVTDPNGLSPRYGDILTVTKILVNSCEVKSEDGELFIVAWRDLKATRRPASGGGFVNNPPADLPESPREVLEH